MFSGCEIAGNSGSLIEQRGVDLGARLTHAVQAALQQGVQRVVVIGTDCPDLSAALLGQAFDKLNQADLVLGPAADGGYYLIGLRALRVPVEKLFSGIDWGTATVLQQTLAKARESGCRVAQLPTHSDVDYPEDLIVCRQHPNVFATVLPTVRPDSLSIIIPTLNEAAHLEATLQQLRQHSGIEILVADGGSIDGTQAIAKRYGIPVITSQAGRGRQMNAGAALARGEVLLFLHADSFLPADFPRHIQETLKSGAIAGAFRLRIDDARGGLRWIEAGANFRSQWGQRPYGDQALFVRAESFFKAGGYPNWSLMEDYELCRRLRKQGKIALAKTAVKTSARRWQKLGLFTTTFVNQLTLAGFHLGFSPERLARWYAWWMKR